MSLTRRSLVGRGALLVASGFLAPSFITRTAIALDSQKSSNTGLILVVLQLSGGNDGLNTVIPFADPNYASVRPSLGFASNEVLPLTDSVGLNPTLLKLQG